ncbi:hypothetical protein [Effusibacillus consociatus]|uniref:ABC transporter substrate-binding protein n=1 Tax=Effusibacillus consociatus TaxID=1117041 RepID=A0ABV9Q135_9BACL
MKLAHTICGLAVLLTGSLLSAGCHAPALSTIKPDKEKIAVGIVSSKELANSKEVLEYTDKVFQQSAVVFDIRPLENETKAQEALAALASNENIDLIITESKYSQFVAELAKTKDEKKFGIVGNVPNPDLKSVRLVNINREHQAFVAGFLLAGASQKVPVGVIVQTPRSSESPDWKGVMEGIHYAGVSTPPTVVTLDEAMAPEGGGRLKSLAPRFFVLLDPVSPEQLTRLQESGKLLFTLHDLPKVSPSVVARPRPIFTEGVQEEVQALLNNSWQGKLSAAVMGTGYFDIIRTEAFPTELLNQSKRVEEGLRNRTLQPETYLKPPK